MEYIRVVDSEKYQHYSNRNPVWIKLYLELLDDFRFTELTDQYKWFYLGLAMLASRSCNKVANCDKFVAKKLHLKRTLKLEVLIKAGLIEKCDSNTLATCYQDASLDKKRIEKKRVDKKRKEKKPTIAPFEKIKKIEKPERTKNVTKDCLEKLRADHKEIDVDAEFEQFNDYCKAKGVIYKDYNAAFRKWVKSPYQKITKNGVGQRKLTANQQTYADLMKNQQQPEPVIEITGGFDE